MARSGMPSWPPEQGDAQLGATRDTQQQPLCTLLLHSAACTAAHLLIKGRQAVHQQPQRIVLQQRVDKHCRLLLLQAGHGTLHVMRGT